MPLCGTKKSKKQKRDPSPPYRENHPSIEEKGEHFDKTVKVAKDAQNAAEKKYEDAKRHAEKAEKENERLRREVQDLKKAAEAKAKDAADGVGMSMLAAAGGNEHLEKLQEAEKKIEVEAAQKQAAVEERLKFEEETKAAAKRLEEVKEESERAKRQIEEELKAAQKHLETERSQKLKAEEDIEKFRREKDTAEATLAHTKKELDIAKKESHIPRSPTRPPTDEWKGKIEAAQTEFEKERSQRIEKEKDLTRIVSEKDQLLKEKEDLVQQIDALKNSSDTVSLDIKSKLENTEMNYKNDIKKLEDTINELQRSLEQKEGDNESLLNRLSSLTAAQVLDNNPNVADLSDPNRPQKLSEQMALLYDDQWTDASEALEEVDIKDDETPKILLKILTDVYNHCKESAENQLSRIEEDIFLPPMENPPAQSPENGTDVIRSPTSSKSHSMSKIPRFTSHKGRPALPNLSTEKKTVDADTNGKDKPKRSLSFPRVKGEKLPELPVEVKKGIKDYRKKVTKQVIPVIEREVMNKLRNNPDIGDKVVDACKSYICRCVELCWLMRVQDPPVTLAWSVPDDQGFDEEVYRPFTQDGCQVDYVVWPAIYLYDGGPMLTKGVAQGAS